MPFKYSIFQGGYPKKKLIQVALFVQNYVEIEDVLARLLYCRHEDIQQEITAF